MIAGNKMENKNDTLIFLDEIQQYPELLTFLKFLQQDGKFAYIASGSLLGVTLAKTTSIPMGDENAHNKMMDLFRKFTLVSGLPDAVNTY